MRSLALVGLFLAACVEEEAKVEDSAGPFVAPLAPPWLGIAGNTYDGALKSTCEMSGEIVAASDGSLVGTIALDPADGGLWAGMALGEGNQVKGTLSWSDCENTPAGEGSFTSSSFSGEPGDLFVLYYNGVGAGFEWLEQGVDHLGGEVRARFAEGTSEADIAALAGGLDATVEVDPEDETARLLAWTDDRNVVEVLAALSGESTFGWGEPVWVAKPGWW
jgi:hypothetical protein